MLPSYFTIILPLSGKTIVSQVKSIIFHKQDNETTYMDARSNINLLKFNNTNRYQTNKY